MTSKYLKLKFDYLKNEKSFRSEIKKTLFLVSQVLSFRHTKQTSKNVADTTFKYNNAEYPGPYFEIFGSDRGIQ